MTHSGGDHHFDRPMILADRVVGLATIGTMFTGVALLFFYRPDNRLLPVAHLVMVALAIQGIVASSVVRIVRARTETDPLRSLIGPGSMLVLAVCGWVVALATGLLLGWDQLATAQVTVGNEFRGFGWVVGDEVEIVVVGASIVEVSGIVRTLVVHLVAATVTAVAGIALPRRLAQRHRATMPPGDNATRP